MRWSLLFALVCLLVPSRALASEETDAVALHRAKTSAASKHEREVAQFKLAVALHRLKLPRAAYGIFSEIVDQPAHARYEDALVYLARLTSELPEPADVDERISRYDESLIERSLTVESTYWRIQYRLGRLRYKDHQYDAALKNLARVDAKSESFARAQFFMGMAYVQTRRPTEAVRAFQRVVAALEDSPARMGEDARLRDIALLSIARLYYSTAIRVDAHGELLSHEARLKTAIRYYDAVDVTSEWWTDAAFEASWAYFVLGEHSRALGFIHTASTFNLSAYDPDLELLRTTIYLSNCQFDDAATLAARFHGRYQGIAIELTKMLATLQRGDRDETFFRFLKDVRDGKANLGVTRAALQAGLSDRELLRHLQYIAMIDDERRRLQAKLVEMRDTPLGQDVKDGLELARELAVRHAGQLARARYERTLAELEKKLGENVELLKAAIAGQRGELDPRRVPFRIKRELAEKNLVTGDDEHVIWPFTGEIWPDEVGTYRQSIRSKCR